MKGKVIFALAVLTGGAAAQTRYGVRNDSIGESWDQYLANNHPKILTGAYQFPLIPGQDACYAGTPMALTSVMHVCQRNDVSYDFVDGVRLQAIFSHFAKSEYPATQEAIARKYGGPTNSEVKTYQNSYGATYKGEEATWQQSDTTIILDEVDVTSSNPSFTSSFSILDDAVLRARQAAQQKEVDKRF
jgi:hypothetical protein